jgi:peroxiredoxin
MIRGKGKTDTPGLLNLFKKSLLLIFLLVILSGEGPPDPWAIDGMVGKGAPIFTLKDMNGNEVSLTELHGKVILINFWATWCPPCREELPSLKDLRKKYAADELEIIAISTDRSLSTLKRYLDKNPVNFRVLHDRGIKVSRRYNVFSLPTSFLINKRGLIVEKFIGFVNWTSPEIKGKIDNLL